MLKMMFFYFRLHARMHLPVKSKTIDEATENDAENLASGEKEPPREKFYCAICGKFYDKVFEQVHVQMHNGEEKFNCSICNKVFPNEESINMHMNAHQDTRIVSWLCDQPSWSSTSNERPKSIKR